MGSFFGAIVIGKLVTMDASSLTMQSIEMTALLCVDDASTISFCGFSVGELLHRTEEAASIIFIVSMRIELFRYTLLMLSLVVPVRVLSCAALRMLLLGGADDDDGTVMLEIELRDTL
jgi:hypothetical protein